MVHKFNSILHKSHQVEFKASLICILSSWKTRVIQRKPISKTKNKQTTTKTKTKLEIKIQILYLSSRKQCNITIRLMFVES